MKQNAKGHLLALFTIFAWGTTFVSTKVLLNGFTPIEILFIRFLIGYFLLLLMNHQGLSLSNKKQELYFIAAGVTGVTLYFLLENIALIYTYASNVGIIIATAPFFTAILGRIFLKEEKLKKGFFIGFLISLTGIILISIQGSSTFSLNPKGDFLAFLAAFVWACYSILVKKISSFELSTIQSTRHIFFYGILFMIIPVFIMGFEWKLERFSNPVYLGNMLFLGVGASAICFVTWNLAVKILGAVRTAVYLYLSPVVTIFASAIVLKEKITFTSVIGVGLVLTGLILSDKEKIRKS